ncbi:MAG: hypothetical protein GF341_09755 [candidate division Zixibacteria bacterium]|nr:hypothetical protein [candidate division Zixibacteria bacterium]
MRKVLLLTAALCLVLAGSAWSFHDEGVAHCNGCHTMHNSQDNAPVDADNAAGNDYLLVDETASDVCLGCHATGLGAVFATDPLTPAPLKGGGNFIFLLEDNLNDGHAGGDPANWIPGDAAGHNLNAPGYGLSADLTNTQAPGGAFNSSWLGCSSCHDPHGNTNFRMLYGAGDVQDGLATFTNAAPEASGLSIFFGSESPSSHTAYASGMSEWCANCHGDFHNTTYPSVLKHPTGVAIGPAIASAYNAYNGTSNIGGGDPALAYLPEVPFEDADTSYTTSSTQGPTSSSKVMCLTCHRAHATSAPDAGRWDFSVTGLAEDGHESGSYAIPNPYDEFQRSLCNKCHVKDANDALVDYTP